MNTPASLIKSPLHTLHVQLGARMIDFAGWSMPVMYRSIIEEHQHTRRACSFFDVSHMGRLQVTGPQAESLLQRLCTRNLSGMEPGQSRYTHICREDGGILDDVIVSRFDDRWLVVCNASNRAKIVDWLARHAAGLDVSIEDQTTQTAMVALQGPEAMSRAEKLLKMDLSDLKRYRFKKQVFMNFPCLVFRSGYTGEDGVEIVLPVSLVKLAMPAILSFAGGGDAAIKPAGLGARDTLRLEAGMPLYGHELTEEWDSLTAGQGWCVDLDKEFIGVEAMRRLKDAGLPCLLAGLELEGRRAARQGFAVLANGDRIGAVTSGALSPTLGKSIAMALIDVKHAGEGAGVSVDISGKETPARVVKLPFYKRPK